MQKYNVDLKGSCLCGEITYHITGECDKFYYCHCQRCRKATGSAHASNLLFKYDTMQWLSGEDKLKTYKVPEAERFATVFCTECGSTMPRVNKQIQFVVLPAGTLDNEPGMKPLARIFQNSRTQWSHGSEELTCFEEYPQ